MRDGDATKCISVLVLTNRKNLSKAEAARYLRYVPWSERGKRHIPEGAPGSFKEVELVVRNDAREPRLTMPNRKDAYGEHIAFGWNGTGQNGVVGSLANLVRDFYKQKGLAYLHEIRISEAATAMLSTGLYRFPSPEQLSPLSPFSHRAGLPQR